MKYNTSNNPNNYHQKPSTPTDHHSVDYYAMMVQQKKDEKILAIAIAILTVLSVIGTYVGVGNLISLGTTWAYALLAVIAIPVVFMLGGIVFLTLRKHITHAKKNTVLTFISVNFLLFACIGNALGVYHLIKLGTIAAYMVAAIVVCIVVYLAVKAIKSKVRGKGASY